MNSVSHPDGDRPLVFTIGHSTRSRAEFLRLLKAYHITCLVDVRTVPRSRHNPQFNLEALPQALSEIRIGFLSMTGLGGFRRAMPNSVNAGWKNDSFRGFADYMQTPEFERNLEQLLSLARYERIALMCAESVPWRCHRSLIADALLVRGVPVEHILTATRHQPHALTPFAIVRATGLTYPAPNGRPVTRLPARSRGRQECRSYDGQRRPARRRPRPASR